MLVENELEQKTSIKGLASIIGASSVGTLIEWYDFYIFGSLATIIATQFFPKDNPTAAFLSTLATFAAGFVVRPFGALFFGRLGDLIGRKYTFMVTLILMGGATFAIGLVPKFETIGYFAPFLVLVLRLLQGLALGGEYGGAATYVAEHSPKGQRGFWTSWIQITATAGLFISLGDFDYEEFNGKSRMGRLGMENSILSINRHGLYFGIDSEEYVGVSTVCQSQSGRENFNQSFERIVW
jgi:Sugar (and other) transporter